jgi:hypothetical protein
MERFEGDQTWLVDDAYSVWQSTLKCAEIKEQIDQHIRDNRKSM